MLSSSLRRKAEREQRELPNGDGPAAWELVWVSAVGFGHPVASEPARPSESLWDRTERSCSDPGLLSHPPASLGSVAL